MFPVRTDQGTEEEREKERPKKALYHCTHVKTIKPAIII